MRLSHDDDIAKARKLYEDAARLGNHSAEYYLGFSDEQGVGGLERNPAVAMRHYLISANQGCADAQYRLGAKCDPSAQYVNAQYSIDAQSPNTAALPCTDPLGEIEVLRWYSLAAAEGAQCRLSAAQGDGRKPAPPSAA